jgi:hypothetical protein
LSYKLQSKYHEIQIVFNRLKLQFVAQTNHLKGVWFCFVVFVEWRENCSAGVERSIIFPSLKSFGKERKNSAVAYLLQGLKFSQEQ